MKINIIAQRMILMLIMIMLTACGTASTAPTDIRWLELPSDIAATSVDYRYSNRLCVAVRYYDRYYGTDAKYSFHYANIYMLEKAKELFEVQFPDWSVDILEEGSIIMEFDQGITAHPLTYDPKAEEAYYHELPDRLMKEDAPDIICLEGADKMRLINGGFLLDLQPYIDFDRLLPLVKTSMQKSGALYSVPTSYSMPMMYTLSPEILGRGFFDSESESGEMWHWTWPDAIDYFEPFIGEEKPYRYLFNDSPQRLTMYLVNYYYGYIYDYETNQYHFEHPVFEEILQMVKELLQKSWIWEPNTPTTIDLAHFIQSAKHDPLYTIHHLLYGITDFNILKAGQGSCYVLLPEMKSADGLAAIIAGEYAVNANSTKREAAINFINILLSDELQNDKSIQYQSVLMDMNAVGYAQAANKFRTPTQTEVAAFNYQREVFFSGVNRIFGANGAPDVMDIIISHACDYYQDRALLSSTIQRIQAEVDSYLHH